MKKPTDWMWKVKICEYDYSAYFRYMVMSKEEGDVLMQHDFNLKLDRLKETNNLLMVGNIDELDDLNCDYQRLVNDLGLNNFILDFEGC